MKKIILLMLLVATACSEQSQKVKIGLNAEYPPYEYIEGDHYTGFNVEFITDVMNNAGIDFEFVNMGFDGLLPALQSKKVDVVLGVSPKPERRKMVDFTISYTSGGAQVLLVHKDSLGTISPDDLLGKTIGTQMGTFQETVIQGIEGTESISYNNYTGALLDLNNKKIDAILVLKDPAVEYLKQYSSLAVAGQIENTTETGYALALNKSDKILREKLNKSIQKLLDDGTVGKYIKKYNVEE